MEQHKYGKGSMGHFEGVLPTLVVVAHKTERHMNRHLVTVKVRIECGAD